MLTILLVWLALLFFVIFYQLKWARNGSLDSLSHLPWIGLKQFNQFSRFKSRIQNFVHFDKAIEEAYQNCSTDNKACVLPTFTDDTVILPPSEIDWLVSQPHDVLNATISSAKYLQSEYTFSHRNISHNPLHHAVVKQDLTRRCSELNEAIVDELGVVLEEVWGVDTSQWKEVNPFQTIIQIVARASNRAFVGRDLCRNKDVLDNVAGFSREVPKAAFILRQSADWLKPILSTILLRENKRYIKNFQNLIRPTILSRQANLSRDAKGHTQEPNDFLQWLIRHAALSGLPLENDPDMIAGRILNVNFAAIHTSTFALTNTVLDLISEPDSPMIIAELYSEITTALTPPLSATDLTNPNLWTKRALTLMPKLDSTLRESSRLHSFLGLGVPRTVMLRSGLTTPISKTFLPYGCTVAVLTNAIHHDARHYHDATRFRPFRFSTARTSPTILIPIDPDSASSESRSPSPTQSRQTDYLTRTNLQFTSSSAIYHPFGHGRNACPGRFFAATELKLILGSMLLHYDFEVLHQRPPNVWMGTNFLPPMDAKIRVRRKDVSGRVEK